MERQRNALDTVTSLFKTSTRLLIELTRMDSSPLESFTGGIKATNSIPAGSLVIIVHPAASKWEAM